MIAWYGGEVCITQCIDLHITEQQRLKLAITRMCYCEHSFLKSF